MPGLSRQDISIIILDLFATVRRAQRLRLGEFMSYVGLSNLKTTNYEKLIEMREQFYCPEIESLF